MKMLGELNDFPKGTMSIGRLDYDSEGLLLLTTDGMVSFNILSKKVEKEYFVQVDGIINEAAIKQLIDGVDISVNGKLYKTLHCSVKLLATPDNLPNRTKKIRGDHHGPTSWVSITIREGKNRQVRKMTAAVGFPTLRLIRVRIGPIKLGLLSSGKVRDLDIDCFGF